MLGSGERETKRKKDDPRANRSSSMAGKLFAMGSPFSGYMVHL